MDLKEEIPGRLSWQQRLRIAVTNFSWGLLIWLPLIVLWLRGALRGIRLVRDVSYISGGNSQQRLDITVPRGGGSQLPIVIYMHGGGFVLGSKFTHRAIGYIYALRGFLVFNLDYRTAPRYRYPAAIEDCCDAYAWIVQNARHYGGDVSMITLAGESAGGNLAAGIMIGACYRRPEPWMQTVWHTNVQPVAAKLICPFSQVTHPERYRGFAGEGRNRGSWESRRAPGIAYAFAYSYLGPDGLIAGAHNLLADPLRLFEEGRPSDRPMPRIFLAVGDGDLLAGDAQRLDSALRRCGARVSTRIYGGEEHVFHMKPWRRRSAADFWRDGFDFLDNKPIGRLGGSSSPEQPMRQDA